MQRDLLAYLMSWKNDPLRIPLLLRGPRQVGKSWLIRTFGQTFAHFAELNFEQNPQLKVLFEHGLKTQQLVEKISLQSQQKVIPGKTLIFLDEIQECPNAILSLRYFKEELPGLHVIAAGSLLDFTLEEVGVPVGRVEFLYVHPLSFGEFLTVSGRQDVRDYLQKDGLDAALHQMIMELLKNYLWLGGMPAVIDTWLKYRDPSLCQRMQDRLINTYIEDFAKYARERQIEHVSKVFNSIPVHLGGKFKYSHVDQELKTYPIKTALQLLVKAGIATPCFHSSGQHIQLKAGINEKKFKLFFFDVGLAQRMLGLNSSKWVTSPLTTQSLGSIAEQFVAQEMIAYQSVNKAPELYYWHKESKSSNAEVDFLHTKNGQVIPIEVKSNIKGGMKSLAEFLKTHPNTPFGVKISNHFIEKQQDQLREVPFYGLEAWLTSSDEEYI